MPIWLALTAWQGKDCHLLKKAWLNLLVEGLNPQHEATPTPIQGQEELGVVLNVRQHRIHNAAMRYAVVNAPSIHLLLGCSGDDNGRNPHSLAIWL